MSLHNMPWRIGLQEYNISPDGEVKLCFHLPSIGNTRDDSAREIWRGSRAKKMRTATIACDKLWLLSCLSQKSLLNKVSQASTILKRQNKQVPLQGERAMNTTKNHSDGALQLPDIDCVLIGVNCSKTVRRCIESIIGSDYPASKLHLYYVDGGSTDNSIACARNIAGVTVIALNPLSPTPGLGRNEGWRNSTSPCVQFLDSDTILDPLWLQRAVKAISGDKAIGAVLGMRRELYPERTIYNWIGDIEWNGPAGESDCFGGDVLIRRPALEKTGGYDETLVGGEDPELSRRIIRAGWRIVRLDALMTRHDLAMTTMKQYWRRAFRSGYGFAAVRSREAAVGSPFWKFEFLKIMVKSVGFAGSLGLSALLFSTMQSNGARIIASLLPFAGLGLLLTPRLLKTGKFMRAYHMSRAESKRYAWHCSVVVIPQFFGIIRFYGGRLFNAPLKNRRSTLATGHSKPAS